MEKAGIPLSWTNSAIKTYNILAISPAVLFV